MYNIKDNNNIAETIAKKFVIVDIIKNILLWFNKLFYFKISQVQQK